VHSNHHELDGDRPERRSSIHPDPTPAAVVAVVDSTNAAIAAGDATVPAEIQTQWETVTAGLRDLTVAPTQVGGDVSMLPPRSQRQPAPPPSPADTWPCKAGAS